MKRIILSLTAALGSMVLHATEYFVSTNGVDSTDGGLTEETAFRTVQYAVNKAGSNDIVTLLPGDHVEGLGLSKTSGNGAARVYVAGKENLVIRSKNGRATRDVTRIVGAWGNDVDEVTPVGMSTNAVRCVYVKNDASGIRLEGLTFYRGSTQFGGSESATDSQKLRGGGVCFAGSTTGGTIVDCAFVECQATRGAGVYTDQAQTVADSPVVVARCLFKNCRGSKYGNAQRGGCAYNCVYDGNGRSVLTSGATVGTYGAVEFVCRAVGCTFVRNNCAAIGNAKQIDGGVLNCLFVYNDGASMAKKTASCAADYCVYEGDLNGSAVHNKPADVMTNPEVASIADGDYRLAPGALSLTVGSMEALDLVPVDFRNTDYLGNARTTESAVYCGAVQGVLTGEGLVLAENESGTWTVNDEPVTVSGSKYLPFARYASVKVKLTPASGSALVRYSVSGEVEWPKMDDSIWALVPSDAVSVLGAIATDQIYWVDPTASKNGTGTEADPFNKLNALQGRLGADNTTNYVVYVKAGDCNKDGAKTVALGGSRFYIVNKYAGNARIKAIDGSEATFISGAAATDSTPAYRCAYVGAYDGDKRGAVALQGFTLRQGCAAATNATTTVNKGGALMNAKNDGTSYGSGWLVDCVVDDCTAYSGAVSYGGTLVRCRVTGCVNPEAVQAGALFYSTKVVSSLVSGCGNKSNASAPLFHQSEVCNCTTYSNYQYSTASGGKMPICNSILGYRISNYVIRFSNANIINSLYDTIYTGMEPGLGCALENPIKFQRASEGDYRLKARSAGVSLGRVDALKSAMDLYGNPYAVTADGRCAAGCVAETLPRTGLCLVFR